MLAGLMRNRFEVKNIEEETLRSCQMGAVGFARIKALRDIETFLVYLERPVRPWPVKRICLHSFNAKEERSRGGVEATKVGLASSNLNFPLAQQSDTLLQRYVSSTTSRINECSISPCCK
jgi:hypothetical protein